MIDIKDVSLILHTCDKYNHLWSGWVYYFKKFWDHDGMNGLKIYFVNERYNIGNLLAGTNIQQLKTFEGEWSDRLLTALKSIKEKYVFYMQEDFWPYRSINDLKPPLPINQLFEKLDMNCLHIQSGIRLNSKHFKLEEVSGYEGLFKFLPDSDYLVNHQFGLWKKDFFISCLETNESAWVNELEGTKRITGKDNKIYALNFDWYNNVCRKGQITVDGLIMINNIK
ncbi:MAG: hypothetical protein WCT85_03825 [Parachlamydiales bacterium]|jgi:hypothetical protein